MKNTIDFGKGALLSPYDIRDYKYNAPRGAFDWKEGYDITKVIGRDLVTKDQNGSGSCGGQAWSYYGEVLEAIATGTYEPRSARWIYAHTRVPSGGSWGRDNCDFVIKNGFAEEADAPSYDDGVPPTESFMAKVPTLSKTGIERAEISRALSYLRVTPDIDIVAQAIADNHGCVLTVEGEDNGTWRSNYPKPPKVKAWAHYVYAGKVKMIREKKYIGIKNSWGLLVGDRGWQWIGEDYFTTGNVREAWTLAWDYKPALHKELLIKLYDALTELVGLLTKQKRNV